MMRRKLYIMAASEKAAVYAKMSHDIKTAFETVDKSDISREMKRTAMLVIPTAIHAAVKIRNVFSLTSSAFNAAMSLL